MGSAAELIRAGALTPQAGPRALTPAAAWAVLVINALARAGLAVLVLLLLWALLPGALGMRSTVVMSGSMAPAVQVGDVVVARPVPVDQLQLGTVLLVDDPDRADTLRLHRLVGVEDGLLRLRGDANATIDSSPVRPEAVHGAAFLRVPVVGMPLVWARTGNWAAVTLTGIALTGMLLGVRAGRLLPGGVSAPVRPRSWSRTARGAGAAGSLVLLIAALGGQEAAPAWAAFSSAAPAPTSTFSTDAFPCLRTIGATSVTPAPTVAYAFAETAGTTTEDLTGQGGTGRFAGSVALVPGSCAPGDRPALRVGGSAPAAVTPGAVTDQTLIPGSGRFTLAAWVKADRAGGVIAGFASQSDATVAPTVDRQLLLNADGTVTFRVGVALGITGSVTTSTKLDVGKWYHLAVTVDSALLTGLGPSKVYVNGVNVASASLSLSLNASGSYLRFGSDSVQASGSNPFQGLLTGAALWNGTALTDTQVAALFTAGH